ncbi:hypothetical protein ACP70R_033400 [Stipagrostis hirtigluma subsp. patula]
MNPSPLHAPSWVTAAASSLGESPPPHPPGAMAEPPRVSSRDGRLSSRKAEEAGGLNIEGEADSYDFGVGKSYS